MFAFHVKKGLNNNKKENNDNDNDDDDDIINNYYLLNNFTLFDSSILITLVMLLPSDVYEQVTYTVGRDPQYEKTITAETAPLITAPLIVWTPTSE